MCPIRPKHIDAEPKCRVSWFTSGGNSVKILQKKLKPKTTSSINPTETCATFAENLFIFHTSAGVAIGQLLAYVAAYQANVSIDSAVVIGLTGLIHTVTSISNRYIRIQRRAIGKRAGA